MRVLILLHRWLGVAFCLLFAMWFASGIVMHLCRSRRSRKRRDLPGLAPIDRASVKHSPAEAMGVSGITDAARIRLVQRSDGPVYLIGEGARLPRCAQRTCRMPPYIRKTWRWRLPANM